MKAILVGLGNAGFSWYKRLRERGLLAAVVESDEGMRSKMAGEAFPFYTSLREALDKEQADFLVNVTPPAVHTAVNHAAFDYRLPVLCEKPISFQYAESTAIVERAFRENIPFMIAENYRRWPFVRKMKQLLDQGVIGEISTIDIRFYRYHHVRRNYTVSLLRDIGVHHFDMIRYLSGMEGRSIMAQLYNPIGGWNEEGAVLNANAFMVMEDGIRVGYAASIAARGEETPWSGNWRIEGTEGALELVNKEIIVMRNGIADRIVDFPDAQASDTLDDFLIALRDGLEFETSGRDYLHTEALVHYADESSKLGRSVEIVLPQIGLEASR